LPIENERDVKWLIERIYLSWAQANIHRQSYFNFPHSHVLLTQIVDLLGYPDQQLLDVLYEGRPGTHYPISSARHLFDTDFTKDGIKSENIGGYNTGAVNGAGEVLLSMEDAGDGSRTPNYGRLHNALLCNIHLSLVPSKRARAKWGMADNQFNYEGVHGSSYRIDAWAGREAFPYYYGDVWGPTSDTMFLKSFSLKPDPRIAWAFLRTGPFAEIEKKKAASGKVTWQDRAFGLAWEDLHAAADRIPDDWRTGVFPITSLNLNILRRGTGLYERACTIGAGTSGRSLYDQMELKVFGFRSHLITRSGVESGIVENAGRQDIGDGSDLIGHADVHANSKYFALADHQVSRFQRSEPPADTLSESVASAYRVLPNEGWQRRINALVDIDEKHFYLIDLYRMRGGEDHWRQLSLLPEAETTFAGLNFGEAKASLRGGEVSVLPRYGKHAVDFPEARKATGRNGWSAVSTATDRDGLSMKLHALFDGGAEVFAGHPQLRAREVEPARTIGGQEMLLWNHPRPNQAGEPYRSQLLNVIEFYGGQSSGPQIRSATTLEVEGADEFGFQPLGCEIALPDRTDYFIFSASQTNKEMKLPNGQVMQLAGRIGHAAFDRENRLIHLEVIGGTQLSCAGHNVESAPEIAGEITAADTEENSIWITAKAPMPEFVTADYLKSKGINLQRGLFQQTYQIDAAEISADRKRMKLKLHLPIIALRSKITAIKPDRLELESLYIDRNTSIHGSRVRGLSGRMFVADGKDNPHGSQLIFYPQAQPDKFTRDTLKKEFRVGQTVNLHDYWIGDTVRIPLNRDRNRN
jgi:hypothetical protein